MQFNKPTFSVKDRVDDIRKKLEATGPLRFDQLFDRTEGRAGLVVTFLALLELINSNIVYAVQATSKSPIHIQLNQ